MRRRTRENLALTLAWGLGVAGVLEGKAGFNELRAALRKSQFVVDSSRYADQSFGSYYVVVSGSPRRRIVWDGKERYLIVQVETGRESEGNATWRRIWIGTQAHEQTSENAIAALRRSGDAAQPAA
jgi:hypothetical protein